MEAYFIQTTNPLTDSPRIIVLLHNEKTSSLARISDLMRTEFDFFPGSTGQERPHIPELRSKSD